MIAVQFDFQKPKDSLCDRIKLGRVLRVENIYEHLYRPYPAVGIVCAG